MIRKILLLSLLLFPVLGLSAFSAENESSDQFITHHLSNSGEWHPLPIHGLVIPFGATLFHIGPIEIKLSLHLLMMFIAAGALILFLIFGVRKDGNAVPKGFSNAIETVVLFVKNEICIPYLGEKDTERLIPFFLTFFFFILVMNLMGLVPLFATATGNISVTTGLALVTFTMMVVGGLVKNGPIGFIKLFLPPGIPAIMYILLFPIELLGLFTRPLALTMRLFGNMLGGHIALYSIIAMISLFGYFGLPALLMGVFISLIDVLAVFLQAFIFTMLSAIFVGSMMHPNH